MSVSSFARASALTGHLLGGCMEVYPDSDLPNLIVQWPSCARAGDFPVVDMRVVVYPFEGDVVIAEETVPCDASGVVFEDVPRERYRVECEGLDRAGAIYSISRAAADVRDGLNERVQLSSNSGFVTARVAWQFSGGASCASLGATYIEIETEYANDPGFWSSNGSLCEWSPAPMTFYGMLRLRLRALAPADGDSVTVAVSEVTPLLEVSGTERVDLGPFALAPCGASCPPRP